MKKLILMTAFLVSSGCFAQAVGIERNELGTGTPGTSGFEQATPTLENDVYFAPQYMPGYPTASTIWPRVILVPCVKSGTTLKCQGYEWAPRMGRSEYLFFKPMIIPQASMTIKEVPVKVKKD